jgi:hypothetical protein
MNRSAAGTAPEQRSLVGRRPAWQRLRGALYLAQVRLRLPIVLIVAALVVGQWDLIRNYWGRLTRVIHPQSIALQAVSSDTEYFCPMDPGVISDWPSKCGVCNMSLVRRKRGEAAALPEGVVARMQLSPNRIQLAGIQTAPVSFRPLAVEYECAGRVAIDRGAPIVDVDIPVRQGSWIKAGQGAEISCPDMPGREAFAGQVRSVRGETTGGWEHLRASIAIKATSGELRAGMPGVARFKAPVSALEPFCSMPSDLPPLERSEPRQVYGCPDHSEAIWLFPGRCAIDQNERVAATLLAHQRVRYWCPMHPDKTAVHAGGTCSDCGGMELKPRIVSFRPAGEVLAVPRSAVIDGGPKKVVFIESMPTMFDGVEVVLGPRCGEFYPVVRGLEPGQKVAARGAFLLDAETRLNPSLATAYFGAARGEHQSPAVPAVQARSAPDDADALEGLAAEDQALARRQKLCPVTNKPLGSMGTPTRSIAKGKVVFLCCGGCEGKFNGDPEKYLAKLPVP